MEGIRSWVDGSGVLSVNRRENAGEAIRLRVFGGDV
jgi:hypothetical protein